MNVANTPDATPDNEGLCRYGNPDCYDVDGQKYYVMKSAQGYCQTGLASWYGTKFHGRKTSSREPYDMFAMTAASRNLPIPTYVEVTNLENGKTIVVKVNDRGPFVSDRIIDLSYAAATKLGFANKGTANVKVRAIDTHRAQSDKFKEEILLADKEIPEIVINPLELPAPTQSAKAITLSRYLQFGAFSNEENAKHLKAEIATYIDTEILINTGSSKGKPIYRVQIGPFDSESTSNEMIEKLHAHGVKNVITVFS